MFIALIRFFIFLMISAAGGQWIVHMFYPELWEYEVMRQAIPYLLLIGFAVGSVAVAISTFVGEMLRYGRN